MTGSAVASGGSPDTNPRPDPTEGSSPSAPEGDEQEPAAIAGPADGSNTSVTPLVMDPLGELAGLHGIEVDWVDQAGDPQRVGEQTLRIVLAALDVAASDEAAVTRSLAEFRADRLRDVLPSHVIAREGHTATVVLHALAGTPVAATILTEQGVHVPLEIPTAEPVGDVAGESISQFTLTIPADLPAGYHTIEARLGSPQNVYAPRLLVVSPDRLAPPAGGRRTFGIAAQLYSVRSASSWGLGDLDDLAEMVSWSGGHGADFVAVNPLCAVAPEIPRENSPYLPTTKRFTDPLYLSVTMIEEYRSLPDPARREIDVLAALVAPDPVTVPADPLTDPAGAVAGVGLLDRDAAWAAKIAALRIVFDAVRSPEREAEFADFISTGGEQLERFAVWNVLAALHGADSQVWAADLRQPGLPLVDDAAREHAADVRFQLWLQWCLAQQLDAATRAGSAAGMRIGVVHDLPIGVHPGGADTWMLPGVFADGMGVGAPPDRFNQQGQDWSAPPMRPDQLNGYGLWRFRDQVRSVLRHAGGVRIDHVLGLFRLWWVPAGLGPARGAYVRYDHEALISVLVLEASRAGAVVVGEDLGTVAAWVQDYLADRGILGTSILWFENDQDLKPAAPPAWRAQTMGSVTVHDLPPTAGYLAGEHVRLRGGLGLLGRPIEEERAADEAARDAWQRALRAGGFLTGMAADAEPAATPAGIGGAAEHPLARTLPGTDGDTEELILALHRYLLATPVAMLAVGLPDTVGDRRVQNLPGTGSEYPNWRLPLTGPDGRPVLLEQLERDPRPARLLEALRAALRQPAPAAAEVPHSGAASDGPGPAPAG